MKRAIAAGLIAGLVSGIVRSIFDLNGLWKLFSVHPYVFPVSSQNIVLFSLVWGAVWGIVFSIFYAMFYDYVPAKGIKKGIIYGCLIWIMAIVRNSVVIAVYGSYAWSVPVIIHGFVSIGLVYGLLIGALYRKQ